MQLTSKAFFGVYQKGRAARRAGARRHDCPYQDKRGGYHNMVTFSKSFINFWLQGWDDEDAGKPDSYAARQNQTRPADGRCE